MDPWTRSSLIYSFRQISSFLFYANLVIWPWGSSLLICLSNFKCIVFCSMVIGVFLIALSFWAKIVSQVSLLLGYTASQPGSQSNRDAICFSWTIYGWVETSHKNCWGFKKCSSSRLQPSVDLLKWKMRQTHTPQNSQYPTTCVIQCDVMLETKVPTLVPMNIQLFKQSKTFSTAEHEGLTPRIAIAWWLGHLSEMLETDIDVPSLNRAEQGLKWWPSMSHVNALITKLLAIL